MPRERFDVIPIQPAPLEWLVSHLPGPDGGATAITRVWGEGDTYRCLLCPSCAANHELAVCQVQVRGFVPIDSAPLFSIRGLDVLPRPDAWYSDYLDGLDGGGGDA